MDLRRTRERAAAIGARVVALVTPVLEEAVRILHDALPIAGMCRVRNGCESVRVVGDATCRARTHHFTKEDFRPFFFLYLTLSFVTP